MSSPLSFSHIPTSAQEEASSSSNDDDEKIKVIIITYLLLLRHLSLPRSVCNIEMISFHFISQQRAAAAWQ